MPASLNKRELPLTKSQDLIWTGQKISPDVPLYNAFLSFRIHGPVDETLFSKAFNILLKKAGVLRTKIIVRDEKPKQIIPPFKTYELKVIEIGEQQVEHWLEKKISRIHNPSKLLFDSGLIRLQECGEYIWYLNIHHLITDASSHAILFNYLSDIYDSLRNNKPTENISIPAYDTYINYEKNIVWSKPNKTYWSNKGSKFSRLKILGNQPKFNTESIRAEFRIPPALQTTIEKILNDSPFKGLTRDISVYNLFTTVIYCFLYKITNQRIISFGVPNHNRLTPLFKKTPGLFVEFYPNCLEISKKETLKSLHKKVVAETFDFLKFSQSGLSSSETNRKFNVIFNYINSSISKFVGLDVSAKYHHTGHNDPRHDLIIQLSDYDSSGSFLLTFDYDGTRYPDLTSEFFKEYIFNIISALHNNSEAMIDEIDVVGLSERQYLKQTINETEKNYPKDDNLLTKFYEIVRRYPDQIAVRFEDKTLTYQEIDIWSNRLANHLLDDYKLRKGDVVALMMDRSLEMIIALYGIIKSGCVYTPIDSGFPNERIKFILDDSKSKLVIIQGHNIFRLPSEQVYLQFDNYDCIVSLTSENPDINVVSSDIVNVIYTSGSTGNPKGVMQHNLGLCNNLYWLQDTYELHPGDHILQKIPLVWDVSIWELFWPLQIGGTLLIIKPDGHTDIGYLINLINHYKVRLIYLVPSLLNEFVTTKEVESCRSLDYVHTGGEALTPKVRDLFFSKLDARLDHQYGVTETGVGVSYWQCIKHGDDKLIPIGFPVSNTKFYVVNDALNLNPIGVPGELLIGGRQVTKGYLNDITKTSNKFIDDPFNKVKSKLYRTGDYVRFRQDGSLEFLGRIDTQLNLRGLRIEPGEIESRLRDIKEIQDAKVIIIEESEQASIGAVVIAKNSIDTKLINQELKVHLPLYMVPSKVVQVDKFPLLSNGKINSGALKNLLMKTNKEKESAPYGTEPTSEIEKIIFGIWKDVFKMNDLSIYDNFIDIGGHSLIAISIVNRIHEDIYIKLPLNILFEKGNVASLSDYIEQKIRSELS